MTSRLFLNSISEIEKVPEHSLKHLLNEAHLNIKVEDAIIFLLYNTGTRL